MLKFNDLNFLAKQCYYNTDHNLRYLALAHLIRKYKCKKILVLGCGYGILEFILPNEVCIVSVDIDAPRINRAIEINKDKLNRTFMIEDIFTLSKKIHDKFDAVVISEVIEHVKDDGLMLAQAKSFLLKEKSFLFVTVPNYDRLMNRIYPLVGKKKNFIFVGHLREYKDNQIVEMLRVLGLNVIQAQYIYLELPKERFIQRFIPVNSPLRSLLLKFFPRWCMYIIKVCLQNNAKNKQL